MALWTGRIAGALLDSEYEAKLRAAGFVQIGIEPTRLYDRQSVAEMAQGAVARSILLKALDGAVMSAFVRAQKPTRLIGGA